MAHDVFISHSAQDKAMADAVCAALENAAVRCWIAPRDVQPGRSFAGEITRAIQQSKVMVLIFSTHSNNSQQVLREVQLAVSSHLHIVQFRIEDVRPNDDLTYFLSTPHWLDAMTPPLEKHVQRLVTAVKVLLAGPEAGEASSAAAIITAPASAPGQRLQKTAPKHEWNRSGALIWLALALLMGIAFPVWNHYRRTERSVAADSSSPAESLATATGLREIALEFRGVKIKPHDYTISAAPYLQKFGVSVGDVRPADSKVILVNQQSLYGGEVRPATSPNILTQTDTGNEAASFTLYFKQPASSVSFVRARLYPRTESGISQPAWSVHALDASGNEIASESEPLLVADFATEMPARTYTLHIPASRPNALVVKKVAPIVALRIDSDPTRNGKPMAAFSAILIERITLVPAEAR